MTEVGPTLAIIPYILYTVFLFASFNFFLGKILIPNTRLQRLITATNVLMMAHSSYLIGVNYIFPNMPWLDSLAPFALVHGPLLYYATKIIREETITKRKILLHFTPFLLLTITFIMVIIIGNDPDSQIGKIHNISLSVAQTISLLGYGYSAFNKNNEIFLQNIDNKTLIIILSRIFMLCAGLLFLFLSVSKTIETKPDAYYMIKIMIYIIMLCLTTSLLGNSFHELKQITQASTRKEKTTNIEINKGKYAKSLISEELMNQYSERLKKGMDTQYYLDHKLSLEALAIKLKIPSHHLSQLLNIRYNESFNSHINKLRIEHACSILTNKKHKHTLEEIARLSGFNSMTSFNRHFKHFKNCNPSSYNSLHVTN